MARRPLDGFGAEFSTGIFALAAVLIVLLAGLARADTGFAIHAFPGATPGQIILRVDDIPPRDSGFVRFQYRIDGGEARDIATPVRGAQSLLQIDAAPKRAGLRLSLRALFIRDGQVLASGWSAPQSVDGSGAAKAALARAPAPEDWDIRAHPDLSHTLQIRLNRLRAAGPVISVRVRRGFALSGHELRPETGLWQDVTLDDEKTRLGLAQPYSLAVVTPAGQGRWSGAKQASSDWRGPPRAPEPILPWQWYVVADGQPGGARLSLASLPYANGAALSAMQYRFARDGGRFAPAGGWGPWQDLPDGWAAGGDLHIAGLPEGTDILIQLRGRNAVGDGAASVPKRVHPQGFGTPFAAVIGAMTPAGSGALRIPKGARPTGPAARFWDAAQGPPGWDYLRPLVAAHDIPASALRVGLDTGHTISVARSENVFSVSDKADFVRFLELPAREKSGATVLIGPEWIDLTGPDVPWGGAFSGLTAPVTFRPAEPARGTRLSNFTLRGTGRGAQNGMVRLEGLGFFLPMALAGQGPRPRAVIVDMAEGQGRFGDIALQDLEVRSDIPPARLGWHVPYIIRAVDLSGTENSTLSTSTLSQLTYGATLGYVSSTIQGNHIHDILADPINLTYPHGTAAAPVHIRDIAVIGNTMHDYMADGYHLHADAFHSWMTARKMADGHNSITGFRFVGNVSFPGYEGEHAPPTIAPTFRLRHMRSADIAIAARDHQSLLRLTRAATVRLPHPAEAAHFLATGPTFELVVQAIGDQAPVRITGPNGQVLWTLKNRWQALRIGLAKDGSGWQARPAVNGYQGLWADNRGVPYRNVEIAGNIIWGSSVRQISLTNRPGPEFSVHHNALMPIQPGDVDGDGHANTPADGATRARGAILIKPTGDSVRVWNNIATLLPDHDESQALYVWDNLALADATTMRATFGRGAQDRMLPHSRDEAIALARPRPGSMADRGGIGPLAADPARDWWNFGSNTLQLAPKSAPTPRALRPAPGSADVPANLPALSLMFDGAAPPLSGPVELIDPRTGKALARWGPGDSTVARLGNRLELALRAPLPAPRSLQVIGAMAPDGWRFDTGEAGTLNLLPAGAIGAPGWQEAHGDVPGLFAPNPGRAQMGLRLDSRTLPDLLQPGRYTLAFDYLAGPGARMQGMVRWFPGEAPRIAWDKAPLNHSFKAGPDLMALKTDVSAIYGRRAGSVFRAELQYTVTRHHERILIDLLPTQPTQTDTRIGRIMLHQGPLGTAYVPVY